MEDLRRTWQTCVVHGRPAADLKDLGADLEDLRETERPGPDLEGLGRTWKTWGGPERPSTDWKTCGGPAARSPVCGAEWLARSGVHGCTTQHIRYSYHVVYNPNDITFTQITYF